MITLNFIIFMVVLTAILVVVGLLLDPMLAIFIVCLLACLALESRNKVFKRGKSKE